MERSLGHSGGKRASWRRNQVCRRLLVLPIMVSQSKWEKVKEKKIEKQTSRSRKVITRDALRPELSSIIFIGTALPILQGLSEFNAFAESYGEPVGLTWMASLPPVLPPSLSTQPCITCISDLIRPMKSPTESCQRTQPSLCESGVALSDTTLHSLFWTHVWVYLSSTELAMRSLKCAAFFFFSLRENK